MSSPDEKVQLLNDLLRLSGKVVESVDHQPGYCSLTINFTDGSRLSIDVQDGCGSFDVEVTTGNAKVAIEKGDRVLLSSDNKSKMAGRAGTVGSIVYNEGCHDFDVFVVFDLGGIRVGTGWFKECELAKL